MSFFESLESRDPLAGKRVRLAVARLLGSSWRSQPVWTGSPTPLLNAAGDELVPRTLGYSDRSEIASKSIEQSPLVTDERLRDLERRWRETGSVQDEVALLLERVRVGQLERNRLELAACLGGEASRVCLGVQVRAPQAADYWALFDGLEERHGFEASVRACLGAARIFVDTPGAGVEIAQELHEAVEAAEDWLVEPTQTRLEVAVMAGGVADLMSAGMNNAVEYWAARLACQAGSEVAKERGLQSEHLRLWADPPVGIRLDELLRVTAHEELVPWALGYSDPVRERVEARQGEAE